MSSRLNFLKNLFIPLTTKKAFLIIFIVGIFVFFNVIFNNFVGDDTAQIVENPSIQLLKNTGSFFTSSTFYNGGNQNQAGVYYKPIQTLSFSFIYTLFGPNAAVFHIFQIIIHILNAFILFLFLKHIFNRSYSLLLSLIFLIHPINSEAVFYISALQDMLFFFFGILAIWLLTAFQSKKVLIFIALFLFLSILSKETGILFICASILYTLIFLRKRFYPLLALNVLIFMVYLLLRVNSVGLLTKSLAAPIDRANLTERLLSMPEILFTYLKIFIFPLNLSSSYQWVVRQIATSNFLLPLLVDLLFIGAIFYFGAVFYKNHSEKNFRVFLFFAIWFLIGMVIHLQIIPLDATLAERWFYFPIIGLLGMIGILFDVFSFRVNYKWSFAISVMLVMLLSIRTFIRSFDWRDNMTLASRDIKVSPEAYDLENIIGLNLLQKGQIYEAKAHIERSIQLYPYLTNYINLGLVYINLGDYPKAKEAYIDSLKYGDYSRAYEALGSLTLVYGDSKQNINFIKGALMKFPNDAKLWLYLAILDYQYGSRDEAKEAISKAYNYDPSQNMSIIYDMIIDDQPLRLNIQPAR